MSKKISGSEYPLEKIFSSDFEYHIPTYQRPYSWTIDQTSELLNDLYDFYKTESEEGYFLGSIVLIKQETDKYSEVIDGQQRLTTLTILFATICSLLKEQERRIDMKGYITEPGSPSRGLEPKPRLTLRDRDKDFFQKYVQDINFDELIRIDTKQLENESQRNIQKNSEYFLKALHSKFEEHPEQLDEFIRFLVTRCYLVAVSTPSQQSAFRVFSVMNSRGLDLQPTDIIKADIIGNIDPSKQDSFNERWEDMEVELGRTGFNNLFQYIRMIYAKEKARKSLLDEFRSHVLDQIHNPEMLIDELLEPYSSVLSKIIHSNYQALTDAQQTNNFLYWLNRIDNSDWVPVAMVFLKQHTDEPKYVHWFFKKLERLAAYLHICSKNINERIERYKWVILDLEKENSIDNPPPFVELNEQEKTAMKSVLAGNIYELSSRRRNYIILRLDAFITDGGARYNHNIFTVEHVLPQTVAENSEWQMLWPDIDKRQYWVHKLANLVPLNRRRNSQAQNFDFEKKKKAYFTGLENMNSYTLTTQVLNTSEWTEEHLISRQEKLLEVFSNHWQLS